jgi:hypothetical protein
MTNEHQTITRYDLEAQIVRRSWEDEAFRMEFTSNPSAAFTKYLNIPAASLPRISVHEEAAGSWHIVLPAKPTKVDELSEQELEKVAGGITPTLAIVPIVQSLSVATMQPVSQAVVAAAPYGPLVW